MKSAIAQNKLAYANRHQTLPPRIYIHPNKLFPKNLQLNETCGKHSNANYAFSLYGGKCKSVYIIYTTAICALELAEPVRD